MIGKTLSHFRILEKLGEGGMGVVYKAEDQNLRRLVALKVLPPEVVRDEERRLRFLREARAAAAVSHPNIATIHEVGEAEGVVFIAMELVEGQTLRQRMGGRPMAMKEALRIATEVAEGLAQAHQAHVIHRDLKPDNVMVAANGHVRILDFGLAKLMHDVREDSDDASRLETISGEMTRAGKVLGTAAYMSPEQARGQEVDARSDIFSFGTTLYEMVTGKAPFQGKTPTDILTAIIRDQPRPASQLNAGVSAELDRIVAECLEKDPRDRYLHTDQLAMDLRKLKRATDSGVQVVRTPGAPMTALKTGRFAGRLTRHPAALAALGLLVVAGGVGVWQAFRPAAGFKQGDQIIVADFENATGRPEFDITVRDAFEGMLSESAFVHVIRGVRLKKLVEAHAGGGAVALSPDIASAICTTGACEGYLAGRIDRSGTGYRLAVSLWKAGKKRPVIARGSTASSEEDMLATIHQLVLQVRKTLRESASLLSVSSPPGTHSLKAYEAFSNGDATEDSDEGVTLFKKAIELDPEFAGAYASLASGYFSLGRWKEYRQAAQEAYRRSSGLPERDRLRNEINVLDAFYDFDAEIERLNQYAHLFPSDATPLNGLAILYSDVREDPITSETYARAGYQIASDYADLTILSWALASQGKADEIERLVVDFKSKGGTDDFAAKLLLPAYQLRGDTKRLEQAIDLLEHRPGNLKAEATYFRVTTALGEGRLGDARAAVPAAWRAALESRSPFWQHAVALPQSWLEARQSGTPASLSAEQIEPARGRLLYVPDVATFCVDEGVAGPLPDLIKLYESSEKGSKSRYVQEELQFVRGCLLLTRGEAGAARQILEPLAHNSNLVRRHRVLGRDYEALSLWHEAADEYEQAHKNPYLKWSVTNPAMWTLDEFRLAEVYQHLGDARRARGLYERFLADWKDADSDIPEVIGARKRLTALNSTTVPSG